MGVGEVACQALITYSADAHQRPRDLSDLERTLDLPVLTTVALEVQHELAFVRNLLAVADNKVLFASASIRLCQKRTIAWGVPQIHDVLAAA